MQLYLFITLDINDMGGVQCYVASKAEFLRENGWEVKIIYTGVRKQKTLYNELNRYLDGNIIEMCNPPFQYSINAINKVIEKVLYNIGDTKKYENIIMESHDDRTSQWGEIIAEKIGAKHIILLMNEIYRGPYKYYEEKIDFYKFKFQRKEILGADLTISRLFEGYEIDRNNINTLMIDENPVQDVTNEKLDKIQKAQYNICYIGRSNKTYVPAIIKGVKEFAQNNSNSTIQFIILSNTKPIRNIINDELNSVSNLTLTELGEMVPIPKELFRRVDVVVAGSGCARCSALEGVLTIVAEPELCKAIGVLGIDTQSSVYWDKKSKCSSFSEALEDVLVKKMYDGEKIKIDYMGVAECTKHNFEAIQKSEPKQAYYQFNKMCYGKKKFYPFQKIKFFLMQKNPIVFSFIKKIVMTLKWHLKKVKNG